MTLCLMGKICKWGSYCTIWKRDTKLNHSLVKLSKLSLQTTLVCCGSSVSRVGMSRNIEWRSIRNCLHWVNDSIALQVRFLRILLFHWCGGISTLILKPFFLLEIFNIAQVCTLCMSFVIGPLVGLGSYFLLLLSFDLYWRCHSPVPVDNIPHHPRMDLTVLLLQACVYNPCAQLT